MPSVRPLAWYFTGLSLTTLVLVVLGAVVRAKGAGLACPDWPLCFGELVPTMDFGVVFEWGHRALAGGVGLGLVLGAILTLRHRALRAPLGGLFALSFAVLAVQVVLGGLTVLHLLASWTVTAHLLTGNAFAITLTAIAVRLHEGGRAPAPAPVPSGLVGLAVLVGGLLLAQFTLGGLVSSRFAGLACTEWPTCLAGQLVPTWSGPVGLQLAHRFTGYALLLGLLALAWAARGIPQLGKLSALALGIGLAQLGFGVANVLYRLPVEVTALHSAGAAALAQVVFLVIRTVTRSPRQPAGAPVQLETA